MPLPLRKIFIFAVALFSCSLSFAQKKTTNKYPSLLWEITGNGLKKPSYLFGTMHVSSKIVFHLSDSVYDAIGSCDLVSLELNPQIWQPEMYKMEDAEINLNNYTNHNKNEFLNEGSFQLTDYTDLLKYALSQEPMQMNGLLYRTTSSQADFEENTYLDLYIYQTGRRLGKQPAGVEDYVQSQKMMADAYVAAAGEKKKEKSNTNDINYSEIQEQLQDAYRNGNLDMLDSLNKIDDQSETFNDIFVNGRNVVQANSIDSILKHHTLFVGVGAAHLPGDKGVIELLRKKGYRLRPIKTVNTDTDEKEKIDKLKVPVVMKPFSTEDNFIQLSLPGPLYKRNIYESGGNESSQYADMENGSYYMLTRVKTHAGLLGQNEKDVLKKVDGLLYENIPGEILTKTPITKNGYNGFDILNKTRRGDIQRYNILVTPYEIIVIKMSGNDDYVKGKEADDFFSSIHLKENAHDWKTFSPEAGGFTASLPQQPSINFDESFINNKNAAYESTDSVNGNAYAIWEKSLNNIDLIEEDTFNLSLMEEGLSLSEPIDKELSREWNMQNGYHALTMKFSLTSGGILEAKAIEKGPHYYMLLARNKNAKADFSDFFKQFQLSDFKYPLASLYTDSVLKFSVQTPVQPIVDTVIRNMVSKMEEAQKLSYGNSRDYWDTDKWAIFANNKTGESVQVKVKTFPVYYYQKDTASFWSKQISWKDLKDKFIIQNKSYFFRPADSVCGYVYTLIDTNSITKIKTMCLLKDNRLYTVFAVSDTVNEESSFVKQFFLSFKPSPEMLGPSVFQNKLDLFFKNYYSKDSAAHKRATDVISNVLFDPLGLERIKEAIDNLKFSDKDYFTTKEKFIKELGYIYDTCCIGQAVNILKDLYNKVGDTSNFQTPVLTALARLQTKESYAALKNYLVQDPPIMDGETGNDEDNIFSLVSDSLQLARTLFPDILELASLEDYRSPVNDLLETLIDSGLIKENDYENYYTKIYFDAKVELKKQQGIDQKNLENDADAADNETTSAFHYNIKGYNRNGSDQTAIEGYATLLIPFYDKYPTVPKFFEKLLQSKDLGVRLDAAVIMLRNGKAIPDSTLPSLAASDKYRSQLLAQLENIKKEKLFPAKYSQQESLARSILLGETDADKFNDIQFVAKSFVRLKDTSGYVYFFKYKIQKDDDWQMGISGVQPAMQDKINSNDEIVFASGKSFKSDTPEMEQFQKKLKELILSTHESAYYFFRNSNREYNYSNDQ